MKFNLIRNLHFPKVHIFMCLILFQFLFVPLIQSQTTVTFNYTGAPQSWTVPAGITSITIKAYGAQGQNSACAGNFGGYGLNGGYATGDLVVTPGQVLNIYVGGQSGYNGGGLAYCCPAAGCKGGNGGGASDVRAGGIALADRVIVAGGGGGGGGGENPYQGGDGGIGGALNGNNGTGSTGSCAPWSGQGGYGGSQSSGGAGGCGGLFPTNCMFNGYPGSLGLGGDGNNQDWRGGGGGGGGYYGGGGGGSYCANGGGGGGSSYIGSVTNGTTTGGLNTGDGILIITYECLISLTCPADISVNSLPDLCSTIYNFPSELVLQYNPTGIVCGNTPIPPSNVGLGYSANNLTTVGLSNACNGGTLPVGRITGSPTVPTGQYLTFNVNVPGGTRFEHLSYDKRSYLDQGPTKASIRSSLDGFSADISTISVNPSGFQSLNFNLSGMAPVSGSITFRIYFYGAPVDLADWADLDGTERGKNGLRLYAFKIASAVDCVGDIPSIVYTNISPSATYPVGTTTITATATDQFGNTAECSFNIIVKDVQAPNITKCPDNRSFVACNTNAIHSPAYNENETGSSYAVYSNAPNNGTGNDNCGITNVTYKDSKSGTCPIVVTRTWKLTDNAGNSKTCSQQINITEPSVNFSCGSSVTMSSCSSSSAIGSAYASFLTSTTGSGGCNGSFTTNAPNNPPGICGGMATAIWTYTTDCSSNSCSRTFTVNAPATVSVTCPENKNEDLCHTQAEIDNSYSNWLNSFQYTGGCNGSVSHNGGSAPSRYGGTKTVTWTVTSTCQGPVTCSAVFSVSGADDDCDGVGNGCDQCPGGNDKIDNNNDGKPDCKFPPSNINQIINAWKCSGNTKVQVCSKSSGGYKTVCTYLSAVQNHINAGGYLGPCGNSGCGGGNLTRLEKNVFMTGEEVVYQYDLTASDYQGIELYPNPAQNVLYVKVQSNTGNPIDLVLYNNIGQKLFAETYSMNHQQELVIPIGINQFSNGLYFVKIMNGIDREVKSFTIQK
ncbi:MAG: T9SS type A sorting domain-containing protein [Saprospiraceae bacterium]|nr:T9SS type A sorting domain-containing protein [Saprospiraceae bacterium]